MLAFFFYFHLRIGHLSCSVRELIYGITHFSETGRDPRSGGRPSARPLPTVLHRVAGTYVRARSGSI
jgi:hypothetical protein